jgi:hypothetical protein
MRHLRRGNVGQYAAGVLNQDRTILGGRVEDTPANDGAQMRRARMRLHGSRPAIGPFSLFAQAYDAQQGITASEGQTASRSHLVLTHQSERGIR